jgi:8-amino-7-oxononanoate synthase
VLDFTSSLYLGLAHDSNSLRPWKQYTGGKPAALHSLPGSRSLASDLAFLAGCEAATLLPSTLHAFWDLFGIWPARRCAVYVDAAAYEIGKWGAERAAAQGAALRSFRHYDAAALDAALRLTAAKTRLPVVVADGFCPSCGTSAPVAEYLDCLRPYGGYLVLDDTQALGILGHGPSRRFPLGRGGGGTMRWYGIRDPQAVLVASLAKAFGVPLAVVAGAHEIVDRFERASGTRIHCSPVPAPALHAAEHALAVNAYEGDRLRLSLCSLVGRLRSKLETSTLRPRGGTFPVQTFAGTRAAPVAYLQRRLAAAEIETLATRDRTTGALRLSAIVTATHSAEDVDRLASVLLAVEASRARAAE